MKWTRAAEPGAARRPPSTASSDGGRAACSPSELGYKGGLFNSGLFKDQAKVKTRNFTGEPPRTSLTAPPTGYSTPSPNHPYGLGRQEGSAESHSSLSNDRPAPR